MLSGKPEYDLSVLFGNEEKTRRWSAENENASARLQLARIAERAARLMSQHEPIHSMGVDREQLRRILLHVLENDSINLVRGD